MVAAGGHAGRCVVGPRGADRARCQGRRPSSPGACPRTPRPPAPAARRSRGRWREFGEALATEGRTQEAGDAFRHAVDLDPTDEVALTALGHTTYEEGRGEDAVGYLAQAAERTTGMSTAVLSLVEMYRSLGQLDEALAMAVKVAEAEPGDAVAALDVAELSLQLGRHDDAVAAFARVRSIDDLPDHDVYALHGMIGAEVDRERWDRARELASEAAATDSHGRTAIVLAYLDAQVGEQGESPPPSREDVDVVLRDSLAEHRRAHAEDERPGPEGAGG